MSFKLFLNEIHFSDIYPKGFQVFYKKWKSKKTNNKLFVNFTSLSKVDLLDIPIPTTNTVVSNNSKEKAIQHSDPAGIYCYPLKYVIDYPSDIWYGRGAKYIRLFELKDFSRILDLQELSKYEWENILEKRFNIRTNDEYNEYMKLFKKFKKDKRIKNYNTAIFNFMQYKDYKNDILYNADEQKDFWLSLGYNGLYDTARTEKKAIINDREPNQILFFNRKDIKMIDYQLLNIKSTRVSTGGIGLTEDIDRLKRKLAQMIFEKMDDKINDNKDSFFYSKKGRYIEINFNYTDSYMDTHNFGEKKHKESKLDDYNVVAINLFSEKGELNYTSTKYDKFVNIVKELINLWDKRELDDSFIPIYNKMEHENKKAKERSEKDKLNKIKLIKQYVPYIQKLCKIYDVKWKDMSDEEYYALCSMVISIQTIHEYDENVKIDEIYNNERYKKGIYLENKDAIDIMKRLLYKMYNDEEIVTIQPHPYNDETKTFKIKDEIRHLKPSYGMFDPTYYLLFDDVYFWKTGLKV
jgi:hypothetical protein